MTMSHAEAAAHAIPRLPILRLLMVSPGRIASTQIFDLVFQGLAEQGAIAYAAIYDEESSPEEQQDAVRAADVVFFLRSFTRASLALLRFAKQSGKLVVYSTDDDFRELDPETPLGRLHHEPRSRQAYESMFQEADLVWLFTAEMSRRYAPLAQRVILGRLPSFVEINAPRGPGAFDPGHDALLVIGYGGSSTHAGDLEVLVRPLLGVLEDHPHVRAQFVNYAPPELARHPHVEVRPFFGNLLSYYEFLRRARWSIGLAPLGDTPFNRGKTSNKYREYAGLGVPGIYSRVPVYAADVVHGETGWLAEHDEASFDSALRQMVASPELRARIRMGALQDAASTYSLRGAQLHFLGEISRLAVARRHLEWKRPRVVAVGYASTSSMQMGVLQPCRTLEREGLLELRHVEPEAATASNLDGADALYVLRAFEERTLPLLDAARARSLPVVAAWDDDFLEIPPGTPLGDYYRHPSVVRAIERFLRESSLVVVSTPPLFARSAAYNQDVLEAIHGLAAGELGGIPGLDDPPCAALDDADAPVRIGFFGSNDALALPWMVEALAELRRRWAGRIRLEAIGVEPPPALRPMLDWWQGGVLPYAESLRLLRSRRWAIGLAPLDDTIFNASKQATKLRDYAWAGAAMVCSRVPTYERALLEGIHCLLAENTAGAWADAIGELVGDPERAAVLRRGAARLLASVHLQEITDASWIQLLWRIGTSHPARGAREEPRSEASVDASRGLSQPYPGARRASSEPHDGSMVVETIGSEPARYAPLSRPRAYRLVPTRPSWRAIEVCVGSASNAEDVRLAYRLRLLGGAVLRQGEIDLRNVRSGAWARIEFPELRNAAGHAFVLHLAAAGPSAAEVGIFESSRLASRHLQRVARRLGLTARLAAPFLRLVYSGSRSDLAELEAAEGTGAPGTEPAQCGAHPLEQA